MWKPTNQPQSPGRPNEPERPTMSTPSAPAMMANEPAVAPRPAATTTTGSVEANATPAPGGGHGLVWVNSDSHIYHKEGSRFYGKTKQGKYMTEADAIKEGDRAAKTGD